MKQLESILKAVADINRIRILKLLEYKKMCVCEIAFVLGVTQPGVSRHLKKLKRAGLIGSEQDSFWTNYFSTEPADKFLKETLRSIKKCMKDDVVIKKDMARAKQAKRLTLCCKPDTGRRKR